MLVRLLYASRAAAPVTQDELAHIVKKSKANNGPLGITGVLCYSSGIFMQALEGGRMPVNQLYLRIAADARHEDVTLLGFEEIGERSFVGWSMGQVNLGRLNTSLLLKYSESAVLDPFAMSGRAAMGLFTDLLASASIIG